MKTWKKLTCLLLSLLMVIALVPYTAPKADAATKKISTIAIEVPKPELGKPLATAEDIWFSGSKTVEVAEFKWYGEVGAGNTAITDVAYTFMLSLKVKDGQDAIFTIDSYKDVEINDGYLANNIHGDLSTDGKVLTVYYRFPYVLNSNGKQTSLKSYSSTTLTLPAPALGKKPATAGEVTTTSKIIDIINVEWDGALDSNGCFKAGVKYTVTVDVRLKESEAAMFAAIPSGGTINGKTVSEAQAYGDDHRKMSVSYTFAALRDADAASKVTEKNNTKVQVTAPAVGAWPSYDAAVPEDWNTYVKSMEWSGTFDKYGRFQTGKAYTLTVTVRVKPTSPNFTLKKNTENVINNQFATIKSVSSDGKEMVITYAFPKLEGTAAAAPAGTPVEQFNAGDYGTLKVTKGTITYLKDINNPDSFYTYNESTDRITGINPEINIIVLEANVMSKNGYLYHAVLKGDKLAYISAEDGLVVTYSDLVRYGNRTPGGYYNLWKTDADYTDGMIKYITTTDPLVVQNGVPSLEIHSNTSADKGASGYYLSSVKYSSDKAQPYSFVTATATYKAKEGRFFYEEIYFDQPPIFSLMKGCSAEIQYIDRETVQILYTVWVEDIYNQDSYTHDMQEYSRSRQELDELGYVVAYASIGGVQKQYVATAEFYNPLKTWFDSLELPYALRELYADNFNIPMWDSPCDNGNPISTRDSLGKNVEAVPATGTAVTLYDVDVSDMFPGQTVGEWAMISGGGYFIPKALLRNIDVTDNNVQGTPGHHVDPVFSFAGGTGTKDDPYLIATAEQLNAVRLSYLKGVYYKLIADIDLSGWGNWVPIGGTRAYGGWPSNSGYAHYGSFCFSGVFDGNGHTISGMTIKIDEDSPYLHNSYIELYFGLFAATTGGSDIVGADGTTLLREDWGVIKNLTVKDFTIDVTLRSLAATTDIYAGGVAGLTTSTKVTNCKSIGGKINIQAQLKEGTEPDINVNAAGLVGLSRDAKFTDCTSTTTVNVKTNTRGTAIFDTVNVNSLVVKTVGNDSTKITNSKGTGKATEDEGALDAAKSKFTDVKTSDYFYKPVEWALSQAVTTGTTLTTFSPNNTCTRAQILTFLWRAIGSPKATVASPFTDVKTSDYFYHAAIWAYQKGMISGTKFAPNTLCTRADTVTYLWKYVGAPATAVTDTFTDVPKDAAYAQAVAWAVKNGVTTGMSATTFAPNNTCTRGQIATFLYRALGSHK